MAMRITMSCESMIERLLCLRMTASRRPRVRRLFASPFLHPTMMRASLLLLAVAISPIGSQLSHAEQDKRAGGSQNGEIFVQYCMS